MLASCASMPTGSKRTCKLSLGYMYFLQILRSEDVQSREFSDFLRDFSLFSVSFDLDQKCTEESGDIFTKNSQRKKVF